MSRVAIGLTIVTLGATSCSDPASVATSSVPQSATSTVADTTVPEAEPETEQPDPATARIGEMWNEVLESELTSISSITEVRGEIWIIGNRYNRSVLVRSSDDGAAWESTAISAPVTSGAIFMKRVAESPQGRIVGIGSRGSDCDVAIDAEDGYLVVGLCFRFHPMVHISDDGGDSWTQIEPASLASFDGPVYLEDIAATDDGFVAVGTIRGEDWRGAIWTSADGETWELNQEIRGDGHPTSADRILIDDEGTVVILGREHPCSEPFLTRAGWVLGSQWADHVRIHQGSTIEGLENQTERDNPLAPAPAAIDCGTQDASEIAKIPYPTVSGEVIDGTITMLGSSAPGPDGAEQSRIHSVIRLVDGAWTETVSDLETPLQRRLLLIGVDTNPGVVIASSTGDGTTQVATIMSEGEGWTTVEALEPLNFPMATLAFGRNGTVLVTGMRTLDPTEPMAWPGNPQLVIVWRSTPSSGR